MYRGLLERVLPGGMSLKLRPLVLYAGQVGADILVSLCVLVDQSERAMDLSFGRVITSEYVTILIINLGLLPGGERLSWLVCLSVVLDHPLAPRGLAVFVQSSLVSGIPVIAVLKALERVALQVGIRVASLVMLLVVTHAVGS